MMMFRRRAHKNTSGPNCKTSRMCPKSVWYPTLLSFCSLQYVEPVRVEESQECKSAHVLMLYVTQAHKHTHEKSNSPLKMQWHIIILALFIETYAI